MKSKYTILFITMATMAVGFASRLDAQVTDYNLFKEDFLNQTGPSTVTSNAWAATANLHTTNAGDISTATVKPSGGATSTLTASPGAPTSYAYQGVYATKSAMDAAFPSGTDYSYAVSGGTLGNETGVLSVPSETTLPYPSAIPSFSDYAAFQNRNAALSFTFTFSGFTDITGGAKSSSLFFDIIDTTTGVDVFSDDFISASTTSIVVPAGTLKPNTTYLADLDYSNRLTASSPGFNGVTPFTGFDYNTGANFTTVPEPSTWWLALAGAGWLILRARAAGQKRLSKAKQ